MQWFCSLEGNEYFCEIKEEYIDDSFNLMGLNYIVPFYTQALDTIQDLELGNCF